VLRGLDVDYHAYMATHLLGKAMAFAVERHGDQLYGRKPYHVHLLDVVQVLRRFIDWDELPQELVDAACLHDTIEDTATTAEQISALFGQRVAELVVAVTNEPGSNRKERQAKTYPKIRAVDRAITVKLADRIANIEQATSHERVGRPPQKLFSMYEKEWDEFQSQLRGRCAGEGQPETIMWEYLDELIAEGRSKAEKFKDLKSFRGRV
jgi:guanosine-3',5'-bis(diphosphate) 3'-pyrophosphohydrolase